MIKFRGKRKDNGERAEGSLIELDGRYFIVTSKDGWCYRRYSKSVRNIDIKDVYEVIPETVAAYTGINDKNGKEIYGSIEVNGKMSEGGDKVVYWSSDGTKSEIHKVVWYEQKIGYILTQEGLGKFDNGMWVKDWFANRVEVIGNQYDNKDLLESE